MPITIQSLTFHYWLRRKWLQPRWTVIKPLTWSENSAEKFGNISKKFELILTFLGNIFDLIWKTISLSEPPAVTNFDVDSKKFEKHLTSNNHNNNKHCLNIFFSFTIKRQPLRAYFQAYQLSDPFRQQSHTQSWKSSFREYARTSSTFPAPWTSPACLVERQIRSHSSTQRNTNSF